MTLTLSRPVSSKRSRSRASSWQPAGHGWQIERDSLGRLRIWRPAADYPADEALVKHAEWTGPTKLVCEDGRVIRQADFFLGRRRWATADAVFDGETGTGQDLADELGQLTQDVLGVPGPLAGWCPPPAKSLAGWLEAAGHVVAMDRDENLRLALTRSGCDGQICLSVQPGHCRFTMPLGRWQDLPEVAEAAMRRLIHQANARLPLVRLAWTARGGRWHGEAQVDLTGLPWSDPCPEPKLALWRATVEGAMAALGRTLHWLGHELPLLAQPEHRELAAALVADRPEP